MRDKSILLALLVAAATAGGCHVVRPGTPEAAVEDYKIEREAKVRLEMDSRFSDVWPECREGVLTLCGRVATPLAAREVEALVRNLRGVRKVVSRVEVHEK